MKNKKIKKCMFGTGDVNDPLQGYLNIQRQRLNNNPTHIEDPNTTLANNQIAMANAQANANTPFTDILDVLGNIGLKVGTGMINKGLGSFAMGGQIPSTPVEIEGNEVGEMPDGNMFEANGPSHEQGGIQVSLPETTKIYSDRIKIDGVSMADRKKKRAKKQMSLEELLEKNSSDSLLQNSLNRTKSVNSKEEAQDLQIQDLVSSLLDGTGNDVQQEFAYGGYTKIPKSIPASGINFGLEDIGQKLANMGLQQDGPGQVANSNFIDVLKDGISKVAGIGKDSGFTFGDVVGTGASLYGAMSPMRNTLQERATDTPNINAFKDFGKQGLDTLDSIGTLLASQRDNQLKKLNLNRAATANQLRGSSRGLNTMRAFDLATSAQSDLQEGNIQDAFTQQLMQILGQKAGMENQQDQMVMQGEQNRDLADRQDKGAFYSNLGRDKATKSRGFQELAKNLNANKYNQDSLSLIQNMKDLDYETNTLMSFLNELAGLVPQQRTTNNKSKK